MIVQIAPAGSGGAIVDSLNYYNIEKIHIITHKDQKNEFQNIPKDIPIEFHIIDTFDFYFIIQKIADIYQKERGNDIYVNITGGSNLLSAASYIASFFIGIKCFYLPKESEPILVIPSEENVIEKLDKKLLKVLLQEHFDFKRQKTKLKSLEKMGLVNLDKSSGRTEASLTEKGKLFKVFIEASKSLPEDLRQGRV